MLKHILRWGWIAGLLWVAIHLKHPLLYRFRDMEMPLLLLAAALGIWLAGRSLGQAAGRMPRLENRLRILAMAAVAAITVGNEAWFRWQQHEVLAANPVMRRLGAHFVVGFRDFESIRPLAERGLIGGIYLSRANLRGASADLIRQKIDALQASRRAAGLPPLFIAADQEGGSVSHLSPLVELLPPLSSLAHAGPADSLPLRAREYGERQGRALANLGVNLNLSPVVDLKPRAADGWPDLHTRIGERAISADPAVVTAVATAYGSGLVRAGVQPTVKHFPGLGRVRGDTHLVKSRLDATPEQLAADWHPFREVTARTGAAMMLAHVTLPAIDPKHPASLSKAVAQGLLREKWGYRGLLMTDDLNMGAVYADGIGRAATSALDAGVDLLLVSYDPDQYYRALHAAGRAWRMGAIDSLREIDSARRLKAFWSNRAG
ncbi:MAG: Beta-N-acetylhexosaminidase [Rhodocyclaceae bacterium]|nr:Beta-N-acetylhexosaminidase [Rhodocyclaceae bacterium]